MPANDQTKETRRSTLLSLRHLFLPLLLIALVISACQAEEDPTEETTATVNPTATVSPTATATPVAEQPAQATDREMRPDAPEYAMRGEFGVGYQAMTIAGNDGERTIEVSAWYPAVIPSGTDLNIGYDVDFKDTTWSPETAPVVYGKALAGAEADDSSGPYPLVVLSHSFTGSAAGYSSLAEHYASHGFIVLAPEHAEQFDETMGDLWTALIDRPADVTRTLDFAEELAASDGAFAGLIDMDSVAVVGHSYGGYTALAMAGAQYDLEAFNNRCADITEEDTEFFLCMALMPNEENMADRAGLDTMPEGLWPSFGDTRVKAIVPMAGDSYLFDQAGLSKITVPVMAMGGTNDFGTPYDWGAKPTFEHASSERKALVGLIGAEHMIFATPCERQPWMSEHPANAYFCFDPVWDTFRAQDLIHHLSTAFLLETLKGDEVAAGALAPEAVWFPGIEYSTTAQ